MKTFTILSTLAFVITVHCCTAQSYNSALGMRFGTDWGLTYKHRIAKKITVEGQLQSSVNRDEAILSLMLEKHFNILTRHANIYWGGGVHKGWIDDVYEGVEVKDPMGITLIGGAELSIAKLNISYDIKPVLNVVGGEKDLYLQSGVSVRYILQKREKYPWEKKKNKKKNRKKRNSTLNKNGSWKFWKN